MSYGSLELIFKLPQEVVSMEKVVNLSGGIAPKYLLDENIDLTTFKAIIFHKNTPIQQLTFLDNPKEGHLENLSLKDLPCYCKKAQINPRKGVLRLIWNRRQKPATTLVIATYSLNQK